MLDRARRFDVVSLVRGFDADVVVMPESFRFADGTSLLDPLADEGWTVRTSHFAPLEARTWRPGDVRPAGRLGARGVHAAASRAIGRSSRWETCSAITPTCATRSRAQ